MHHAPLDTHPNNLSCTRPYKEYNNAQLLGAGLSHKGQDDEIQLIIASQFREAPIRGWRPSPSWSEAQEA